MLTLLWLTIASAHAAVTGLSPSSATVIHESNGWPDYRVAVQVQGTGAFTVSGSTCYDWKPSVTSGTAPTTIYIVNYPHTDNIAPGTSGTCAVDITGGSTFQFTFNWSIRAAAFPPQYSTTVNKTPDASLSTCSKSSAGDFYRGNCTSPDPRPGGDRAGWPTSLGGTYTDPTLGGVLTRLSAANHSHVYSTLQMISSDGLYALLGDLVAGANSLIYEISNQTLRLTTNLGGINGCQWSSNPSTPRVIWCVPNDGTVRKRTITGTPPSGFTDNGTAYSDSQVNTGLTSAFSLDDTMVYWNATQLCAVNLITTSIKTCSLLSSIPDPAVGGWNFASISPGKDVDGYRYAVLAPSAGASGVYTRVFKWRDGDASLTLLANGIAVPHASLGATWDTSCNGIDCVVANHLVLRQEGTGIYYHSPDPVKDVPDYKVTRAVMRIDGVGSNLSLRKSSGGGLSFGPQGIDTEACATQAPICVAAGSQSQGVDKASCLITAVTTGNPWTVTVSSGCGTFSNGQSLYISGAGGVTGVNGRPRVVATSPTSLSFTVASASSGTYTSGGVVTVDMKWAYEDADNEVVAWRPATGHVRRIARTGTVPFSNGIIGSANYWAATRVTISPDGKTGMFASNGGDPVDIANFTFSTGFDVTASTPANQFDQNGRGYTLAVAATSVTANITTSSSQSCTFAVSANSDLSGATTASGTINTTGPLTVSSLTTGTHYYSRVVCDESNVAVAEFTAGGGGGMAGSMSGSIR